ncbi:MAG: bifunctional UDP-N-acetylglucosamine diphosphorylase/glucosamine-1-phosphate N-acetyltransferase GlmU [Alphaproteobacteria bacterium]
MTFAAVVLAAGMGTRMNSRIPKVLHPLAGQPVIAHLLDTLDKLQPDAGVVIVGPGMEGVSRAVAPWRTAVQAERLGTGDAVKAAREALAEYSGTVLILYGADPLISADTLRAMLAAREAGQALVVLGFRPQDCAQYGRLAVGADGSLEEIVEFKDATPKQREITLCNSGFMAVDGQRLFAWLDRLDNNNAKGEYYLPDLVAMARGDGLPCGFVEVAADELLGIDSRADLAAAEALVQAGLRAKAMAGGATLIDPGSVWFSYDTQIGRDVLIHPNVVFGPGCRVADDVEIKAFSHLEGAHIAEGAIVGPFARLRPGAQIGRRAKVGNFVEIKNAVLGEGAKAGHLSYLGDGDIGAGANIGAGTIFCNYDGFDKARTTVGAGAFIGSNSALIAPVSVGEGSIVAAGSTISDDVPADGLAIARGRQVVKKGWAKTFRARKKSKD